MAKLERKLLAHLINVGTEDEPNYVRLGKDLEEYTPQLSAQVERTRNILGENNVYITGYEKSGEVATYYADPDDPLYQFLERIIDRQLTGEALKVQVVELRLWERDDISCRGAMESAYLEVTGYGGDTTGVQIAFKLHYLGDRRVGDFDMGDSSFNPDVM